MTKTDIINLALLKLSGLTSSAMNILTSPISASVFADPTTATGQNKDDIMLYCTRYEPCLLKALKDIRPKWAKRYADLGYPISITEDNSNLYERGDWYYMFDIPTDYLALIRQTDEGSTKAQIHMEERVAYSYAHVVAGDDGNSYYCDTAHTSVDDANDGQPSGNDGSGNWTQFSTDDGDGETWEEDKDYVASGTAKILLTNELSNADGDSAYIEYLAYVQAGISDDPTYYDPDFVEAFVTLLASEMAPWSTEKEARAQLRQEYELLAKTGALGADARTDYEKPDDNWLEARTK